MMGNTDGRSLFPMTRAERRSLNRRRSRAKSLGKWKAFGMLAGLSVTSIIGSHMARGTQALLTDHATQTEQVSAISYFPDTLAGQAELVKQNADEATACASSANDLSNRASQAKGSGDATGLLNQAEGLLSSAKSYQDKATSANATLSDWVNQDAIELKSNDNPDPNSSGLTPMIASSPLPEWALSALSTGSNALDQANSAVDDVQNAIGSIQKSIDSLKAAEAKAAVDAKAKADAGATPAAETQQPQSSTNQPSSGSATSTNSDTPPPSGTTGGTSGNSESAGGSGAGSGGTGSGTTTDSSGSTGSGNSAPAADATVSGSSQTTSQPDTSGTNGAATTGGAGTSGTATTTSNAGTN